MIFQNQIEQSVPKWDFFKKQIRSWRKSWLKHSFTLLNPRSIRLQLYRLNQLLHRKHRAIFWYVTSKQWKPISQSEHNPEGTDREREGPEREVVKNINAVKMKRLCLVDLVSPRRAVSSHVTLGEFHLASPKLSFL